MPLYAPGTPVRLRQAQWLLPVNAGDEILIYPKFTGIVEEGGDVRDEVQVTFQIGDTHYTCLLHETLVTDRVFH
jgi:hypothetical protein